MDLQKYIYYQSQIDYRYFILSKLSEENEMSYDDIKKESLKCIRYIIRTKIKLGYDTSNDKKVLKQINNDTTNRISKHRLVR